MDNFDPSSVEEVYELIDALSAIAKEIKINPDFEISTQFKFLVRSENDLDTLSKLLAQTMKADIDAIPVPASNLIH